MLKSRRGTNFSKSEEAVLIRLVLEKKHIFENKKTDTVSSKLKDLAWQELAQKYNATSLVEFRSPKVLREKYNNIKRCLRKGKAKNQRELENSLSPKCKVNENDSLIDELSIGLTSRNEDVETIIAFEKIDNQNVFKTEIIDYNDEDFEENAEVPKDCDYNCATSTDVDMRIREGHIKTSFNNWQESCPCATLKNKAPDISTNLNNITQTTKVHTDFSDLNILKKRILQQQFHHASLEHEQKLKHARLEHEQRISQSAEEHKIKIQILKTELELKKFSGNITKE